MSNCVRCNEFKFKLPLVLDGATGTNLIARGLPAGECVEKWVCDNSNVIIRLQREFISAGADVVYAPTFSANKTKLAHYCLEDEVESLCRELVSASKKAVEGTSCLVGGDISPTGEFCEPFGLMSFDEMIDIFTEQAEAIYNAGADLFVIETMMSLQEMRAAVFACRKFDLPVFVTCTIDESGHTLTGATPLSCLITLQAMGVSAFGLNCSNGPIAMAEQLKKIYPYAQIPLIAKPNAGQPNPDDETGCTYELSPQDIGEQIVEVLKSGAQIVGGCCGNTPEHLKEIAKTIKSFDYPSVKIEKMLDEIIAASEGSVFFLNFDAIRLSEPLPCEVDMSDVLLEIEDDTFDAVKIVVDSADDGYHFAQNAHMCKLPVVFYPQTEEALRNALKYYCGRAIIDSECPLSDEIIAKAAEEFGAIIY